MHYLKSGFKNKSAFTILLLCVAISLYSQFAGGSGTVTDPYQVATAEQLNNIRNYRTCHFVQIADIDLDVALLMWVKAGFLSAKETYLVILRAVIMVTCILSTTYI